MPLGVARGACARWDMRRHPWRKLCYLVRRYGRENATPDAVCEALQLALHMGTPLLLVSPWIHGATRSAFALCYLRPRPRLVLQ